MSVDKSGQRFAHILIEDALGAPPVYCPGCDAPVYTKGNTPVEIADMRVQRNAILGLMQNPRAEHYYPVYICWDCNLIIHGHQ